MALHVITGPPCSGKSTYLAANAKPGDIRIDFDDLAQAFGSTIRHGHSTAHQQVTIAARRAAIETAVRWSDRVDVWIVDCNINPKRAQMYERANAHIVTLSATPEELHRRAHAERPRAWHGLIDNWQPSDKAHPPSSAQVVGSRAW